MEEAEDMTTTRCRDRNLRDYLIYRLIVSGPFWLGLILIFIWVYKLLFSRPPSHHSNGTRSVIYWLEPYLRPSHDIGAWLVLHFGILLVQLIEGYCILTIWWRWFTGYWSWELERCQCGAQLWQAVILVMLTVALVGLLLAGLLLVLFAAGSIIELWRWKPNMKDKDVELSQHQESEKDITS